MHMYADALRNQDPCTVGSLPTELSVCTGWICIGPPWGYIHVCSLLCFLLPVNTGCGQRLFDHSLSLHCLYIQSSTPACHHCAVPSRVAVIC